MTNIEKASELAIKLEGEIGTSPNSRQAIEEAFLEMAEWKDKEMQETIEVAEDHAFFAGSYKEREKFAREIHEKIVNGATVAEIDNYVCGIEKEIIL